jgi:hypothetical protein
VFAEECVEPLIENGYDNVKLTATSRLPGRGPENAKIYCKGQMFFLNLLSCDDFVLV